jgi:hypothetical protein
MRCIHVILSASLVLLFVVGCQPSSRTEVYFVQSQERNDPESESANYTQINCTGPTTESLLDTRSIFLDAYFYGVEISSTTGLVSSDLSPENRVGFGKACLSAQEFRSSEEGRRLLPIIALTGTMRGTVGLYLGEDPDLEFEADGEALISSIFDPVSLAARAVMSSINARILEDPSVNLVGGRALASSTNALTGDGLAGSFWTFRLIFDEEQP